MTHTERKAHIKAGVSRWLHVAYAAGNNRRFESNLQRNKTVGNTYVYDPHAISKREAQQEQERRHLMQAKPMADRVAGVQAHFQPKPRFVVGQGFTTT